MINVMTNSKILTDYFDGYQVNIFFCLARARGLALTSWFGTAFVYYSTSPNSLTISARLKRRKPQNACLLPPFLLNYCQYIVQI